MRLAPWMSLALSLAPLAAQESEVPLAINLPTTEGLAEGDMAVRFTHRFQQSTKAGSHEAYGMDGHAQVGIGFDTSIKGWWGLNFQAYRTADMKTVTLALQQKLWDDQAFKAALRVERFDELVKDDPSTPLQEGKLGTVIQAPLEWRPSPTVTFLAVPTWLSRSQTKRASLTTVGLGARWEAGPAHVFTAEFYPRPSKVSDVRYGPRQESLRQGWAMAYTWRTRGHRFSIVGTTAQGTTAHQVLAGDYVEGNFNTVGPRAKGLWALGFNLIRIF